LANEEFGRLDLADRVGCSAVLGIKIVTGKNGDYAALTSIIEPPKGAPERQSPLSRETFDPETYRELPGWLQEVIARSPENNALGKGGAVPAISVIERLKRMLEKPAVSAATAPAAQAAPLPDLRTDLDDEIAPWL
jgi:hypothetical protein